ncbi:hypothetical protein PF005_g33700 [Phytophthora fragariae]|uniref:Secreted protein n=1 Tax=Phytophthora fragariae TaxID=53985 RepID=A0A6A3V1D0_9STRA|nr:hypothetical protein PF009_g32715 [Phytophthora fragariae]KAE9058501.1 hypothetical protein PF010_g30973 [Phytophthora fragariae]KAE9060665.1 hypothetical protein PF007_g30525 [Phytophthora fragariae]KAE9144422.1 hypothetical protein PF005_g33700 [Phytophthora fragariae]KAE9159215.1 hypothetical protein PF002_g32917 [Phytophthora fragariae]
MPPLSFALVTPPAFLATETLLFCAALVFEKSPLVHPAYRDCDPPSSGLQLCAWEKAIPCAPSCLVAVLHPGCSS